MSKVYVATKDDLNQTRIDLAARFAIAAQGESTATPATGDADGTPVGRVVFDCVLRNGYVKANGATVGSASQDYPRLVEFVLNHPELLAADEDAYTANTALYMYNVTSDVMTLPNYVGRVMQGGNDVVSVNAGLPEIHGFWAGPVAVDEKKFFWATDAFSKSSIAPSYTSISWGSHNTNPNNVLMHSNVHFYASSSNTIYGASSTVQPPAITLIPQIRY